MIKIKLQKQLQAATGQMDLLIDLQLEKGDFVAICGASGAGKTSILRMIAGLMSADSGEIIINKKVWLNDQINQGPQQRKVGLVFQNYALFPNMTVAENLRFALHKGQDDKIIMELLEIMELTTLHDRRPNMLSGGQQQRVALARALVQQPDLLLLDEPLSALDTAMREKLQGYILEVHRRYGLTTILVSHDQNEIERLANRVIILEQGNVIKDGTPFEVFYPDFPPPILNQAVSIQNISPYTWGEICQGWQLINTPQLSVIQEMMPPQAVEARHSHSKAQQFFYILKGKATFDIENKELELSVGQGVHILPNTIHQIRNETAENLDFLVVSQPHAHGDRSEDF